MRAARRFVTAQLTAWGEEAHAFTASLLVSELVTNAILHARTEVSVEVESGDGEVRISVVDRSPVALRSRRHSLESGTGRGLMLVEQLARRWGVENRDPGKAIWFVLDGADEVEPMTTGATFGHEGSR